MRVTAELRWFWQGSPAPAFKEWFVATGPAWPAAVEGDIRTDEYLRDPDQNEVGIKKRGGAAVEVKGLVAQRASMLGLAGCAAPVELWAKWRSKALKLPASERIAIDKKRWMRRCAVVAGRAAEIQGDAPATRSSGCDVELTLLTLPDGVRWWTFAFEAFGALDQIETDLAATVALMESRRPPVIPPGQAAGYPAWLARLLVE